MLKYGFFSVASVSPKLEIGNPVRNVENILATLDNNEDLKEAQCVVFPELSITGYTCGDLFFQQNLINSAMEATCSLIETLKNDDRLIFVGLPVVKDGILYNCAAAFCKGEFLALIPKTYIPNYQEFYEKRWFKSGYDCIDGHIKIKDLEIPFGTDIIINHSGVLIGAEICEDLWVPVPPSSNLCLAGAEVIVNLSATDDNIGKYNYIRNLVATQSSRCRCAYAYASAGKGESSTDLVFSGINIIACNGNILDASERFDPADSQSIGVVDIEKLRNDRRKYSSYYEDSDFGSYRIVKSDAPEFNNQERSVLGLKVAATPFIPENGLERQEVCGEVIEIQSWGLLRRLDASHCDRIVVGISGGLDSTLALLVAHHAFKKSGRPVKDIISVTMPAEATSERTHSNARMLMEELGVTLLEIPIKRAVELHFEDIGHDHKILDAVYENSQARERTQILMDLANKYNALVLGTGDMSELALGWCTYNGDHMSMYNVNGGVPKTLVKYLVDWFADNSQNLKLREILKDIIQTPISPELIPAAEGEEITQKTEEIVGPYELHDFYLFHVIRNGFSPSKIYYLACCAFGEKYDKPTLKHWLINFYKRFFSQQFKRSCMPDGPKVGSVCLSPRGDWRMPSDANAALWINEAEAIEF